MVGGGGVSNVIMASQSPLVPQSARPTQSEREARSTQDPDCLLTNPLRIELIREVCVELSPKNIFDENICTASVFSVVYSPRSVMPNERLTRGSFEKLPLSNIMHRCKPLRAVFSRRKGSHGHL
jgi:hypothetical protein